MSSTSRETTEESAESYLNKLYADLYHLVNSVEKGSGSELTVRLRNVETYITGFKELLRTIPDIGVEEEKQRKKIAALYRQIKQKDELLESLAAFSLDGLENRFMNLQPSPNESTVPETEAKTNEDKYVCNVCQTVVILKNIATHYLNEERELPLPRQKKGIDYTETEPIHGFFGVKDVFAFENVAVTRSAGGKVFLVCGECEQGPVGFLDSENQIYYIAPARLAAVPVVSSTT